MTLRLCPVCGGDGFYAVPDPKTGEPKQEQCGRCFGTGKVPEQDEEN